jgi:cell division protein FtsQ
VTGVLPAGAGAPQRPPTDPRIRQRRVEVARAAGRRRLRLLSCALGAALVGVAGLAVLHSPLLAVHHVDVVGAPAVDRAEVLRVSGLATQPPLVDVDLASVERRIATIPEVATVTARKEWPTGVEIVLTQRQPVAAAAAGQGYAVLDLAGHVLRDTTARPAGLPLVLLAVAPGPPGSVLPARALPLISAAQALPAALQGAVEAIGYLTDGSVVLRLQGRLVAVLGDDSDLRQKFESLSAVLAQVPTAGVSTIDLSVGSAPVLTPTSISPTVQEIVGG